MIRIYFKGCHVRQEKKIVYRGFEYEDNLELLFISDSEIVFININLVFRQIYVWYRTKNLGLNKLLIR